MNPNHWLEASRKAIEKLEAQPLEQQRAWLIRIGILDENGELSSSYGGPGRSTDKPNWMERLFGTPALPTEPTEAAPAT